jgi:hypothetical protein
MNLTVFRILWMPPSPFRTFFPESRQPQCARRPTKVCFCGAKISNILPEFDELFVGHFAQMCAKSFDIEIIGADFLFHIRLEQRRT